MNARPTAAASTATYTLGDPQIAGALAVYPVFGPPAILEYRAFVQAAELGALVKELDHGAAVGTVSIQNPTDLPLLVYEGEEVLGAQQNRTFDASVLVPSGGRLELPVSCVEQGRWDGSRHAEAFRPSPQAADPTLRRTKRAAAERAGRPDQGEVWAEVSSRLAHHGVDSASAAMSDVYDRRRGQLGELGRAIRHLDGQTGAVACVSGRPVALDLVSRADVFAALLPPLAQGYALDALGAPEHRSDAELANGLARAALGAPEHSPDAELADGLRHGALGAPEHSPDPERADAFLHAALAAPRVERPTPGIGRAVSVGAPALVGAGLEHERELLQLSAFPAGGGRGPERHPRLRVARPSRRSPRR